VRAWRDKFGKKILPWKSVEEGGKGETIREKDVARLERGERMPRKSAKTFDKGCRQKFATKMRRSRMHGMSPELGRSEERWSLRAFPSPGDTE
jgi:hypothetical protein